MYPIERGNADSAPPNSLLAVFIGAKLCRHGWINTGDVVQPIEETEAELPVFRSPSGAWERDEKEQPDQAAIYRRLLEEARY